MSAVVVALLAAVGVPGVSQATALASSPTVLNWTKQHPAVRPSARDGAAMAYDAATGTAVLFGGVSPEVPVVLGDTWTWNGSTWAHHSLAIHPPARWGASMAYDAATGTVVLFGGDNRRDLGDTWTWDGSTWTQQHPATSPPARDSAMMAYDAATGTVVLFGGFESNHCCNALGDTWTWNGSTWTQQHPATSPPVRDSAMMAYDAATGTVVLFGGTLGGHSRLGDTWTWDGSAWTKQSPATRPARRLGGVMAYDGASGNVVMFGGLSDNFLRDTWTWGSN